MNILNIIISNITAKTISSLFIFILIVGCSTTKKAQLEQDQSIYTKNYKILKDSIFIITPDIEIKEKSKGLFIENPKQRKLLSDFTIKTIKSKLPNARYVKVPFLFEDYLTINTVLEGEKKYRSKQAPKQLLFNTKKHSIFISINGYYGDINEGQLMLYLIDNNNKTWKLIKRYEFDYSPLITSRIEKRIIKVIEKL
ncbi:hypothetical protein [Aureibaculum conchae]|uniref:hypothetical protein n=1 Tax=Aureibaculum sp. 2308TA14-22 TaxID=3108392 RepID=UPI0033922CE1